jgi:hypothetical protein
MAFDYEGAKAAGYTDDQIKAYLDSKKSEEKQAEKSSLSAGEVAIGAITSFPSSVKKVATETVEALTSPIQTAKSVLDLGAGILQNVLPEKLVQTIGEDKQSRELANKVGEFYAQKYGSVEAAKRAVATDPASVMADLSTVFTGGAMLPTRAAPALSTMARSIDPLMATLKATGAAGELVANAPKQLLGKTTGVGTEPISQGYQAGLAGGEQLSSFKQNLRGQVPNIDVLDAAKENLRQMNIDKQREYRSGMIDVKNDATILKFDNIDKSLQNAAQMVTYEGKIKDADAAKYLSEVASVVNDYKSSDPTKFHTPIGLDALKQTIGNVLNKIPPNEKTAYSSVKSVYDSVKNEITAQAPTYAETMKAYTESTELIREIERALSLGEKKSADTAMRKLQSVMRNNVNTNYGQRLDLVKQLESSGNKQLMPALAGQTMADWMPRGMQGALSGTNTLLASSLGGLPAAAIMGAASSPRLIGESSMLAGQLARGVKNIPSAVGQYAPQQARNISNAAIRGLLDVQSKIPQVDYPTMFNLLYQANQPKD